MSGQETPGVTQAKQKASILRWCEPLPVRVYQDEKGRVIWSKVEEGTTTDLTPENSDGMLYHIRSLFVSHGAENPLISLAAAKAREAELVDHLEILANREQEYRAIHDLKGDGSHEAGRAWDLMRRAGDEARALIAKHKDAQP